MSDRVDENRRDYNRETTRARNDVRNTSNADKQVQGKSAFDKVMEERLNLSRNPYAPSTDNTVTREAAKPVASQQERYGKEKESFQKKLDKEDKGHDEKKATSGRRESTSRAKEAEKKVVSRESSEEKGSGGQSQGEGGHSGSGGQSRGGQGSQAGTGQESRKGRSFQQTSKAAGPADSKVQRSDKSVFQLDVPGMNQTSSSHVTAAKNTQLPRTLSKAALDQIVQYSKIMTRTDGDREMEVQLKEDVFKGLRLRVRMKEGKIAATFLTHSEDVRKFFQAQKSDISKALEEKGIVVSSLNVIFS